LAGGHLDDINEFVDRAFMRAYYSARPARYLVHQVTPTAASYMRSSDALLAHKTAVLQYSSIVLEGDRVWDVLTPGDRCRDLWYYTLPAMQQIGAELVDVAPHGDCLFLAMLVSMGVIDRETAGGDSTSPSESTMELVKEMRQATKAHGLQLIGESSPDPQYWIA
jgi:hypothetical protein